MIPKRDETMGEYIVDLYYSNNSRILYDNIDVDFFYSEIEKILQEFLQTEQEHTNKMNDMKEQLSQCKKKNIELIEISKTKPDPKSSNIWFTIIYLTIILIITKLIFGSIPPIVIKNEKP